MTSQVPIAIAVVFALLGAALGFGAGYIVFNDAEEDSLGTVMDAAWRKVQIPESLDNGIVTAGVDTLRFVSYFNMNEKVVMVDLGDKSAAQRGKGYQYAYEFYKDDDLPSHSHNQIGAADVETIGELGPSLIIVSDTVYNNNKKNCDILAGTFTLVVIYEMSETGFLDEDNKLHEKFIFQLELLGAVFQKEDRARELIDGINGFMSHIKGLIPATGSNDSVYLAGLVSAGAKELDWTSGNYAALRLINGTNAYTESNAAEAVKIGPEKVGELDIDVVFVDPSAYDKIVGNAVSKLVLEKIRDKGSVKIYTMLPYFWFGLNFDSTIANAYYMASILYPGTFADDAEMMGFVNDVFELFYGDAGANVFDKMDGFFSGCPLSMPLLVEMEIVEAGGELSLAAVA